MNEDLEGQVCGVDGCTTPSDAAAVPAPSSLDELNVVSDVICPWCYVGKRRLERALTMLDASARLRVTWRPFELNPQMPKEGIERSVYRMRKFGSLEHS